MTRRMVRALVALFVLLSVLAFSVPPSAFAQDTAPASLPGNQPVIPAAFVGEQSGEIGTVYLWDSPENPGVQCALSAYTHAEFALIPAVQISASPGKSSQLVDVYASVWAVDENGDATFFNYQRSTGTTDPGTGDVFLPAEGGRFEVYAGYSSKIVATLTVYWYDGSYENEIGYLHIVLEYYDNSMIGGGIEDLCYFSDYAPTPTPVSGGFVPGDWVRTTSSVNLRQWPGTQYPSLGVVPANTLGRVIGFPEWDGSRWWYPVTMEGFEHRGYIRSDYLVKAPNTPTPTPTRTPNNTSTPTPTPTVTQTSTLTVTPSNTPTVTNTATPSQTPTVTNTPTLTNTPTVTHTPTITNTATASFTPSNTPTRTNTPVATNTFTATATRTPTATPTMIPGGFVPGDLVRTTTSANLRSGPGTGFSVLGVVPANTQGAVTGFPTFANGYTWYPVSMNGFPAGYIAGHLLAKLPGTATSTATATATWTPTVSPTASQSPTASHTPTITNTATITLTPAVTNTPAQTATRTPTRTPTALPGGFLPGDLVRTTTKVNLRSGPGTGFSVLGVVPSNTGGTVLSYPVAANGYNWYQVSMNGFPAGWLAGNYLTKTGAGPTATPLTLTPTRTSSPTPSSTVTGVATATPTTIPGGFAPGTAVQVNTGSLNLRAGPGTNYASLGVMPRGTTGTVTGYPAVAGSTVWYPVEMTGYGAGWVAGQYLTSVLSAALEPNTETPAAPVIEPTLAPSTTETATGESIPPTEEVMPPTEAPAPTDEPVLEQPTEAPAAATP